MPNGSSEADSGGSWPSPVEAQIRRSTGDAFLGSLHGSSEADSGGSMATETQNGLQRLADKFLGYALGADTPPGTYLGVQI